MKFDKIHHVAIIVSDYGKSKDFYVNTLGFEILHEVYREERGDYRLDVRSGACRLEIFGRKNPPKRVTDPEACGLRHLAFYVEDVETAAKELETMGIPVDPIRVDPLTGQKTTFFRDPDGLPLELYGN